MKRILLFVCLLTLSMAYARGAVDPNFHIYLCFGQSNMEGNADAEAIDNQYVDPRFQMLATTNFSNPNRTLGQWYTATTPIVSPAGKLGMSDYFGRTMVAAMPSHVKVGVVAVAMGGSPIEMFDKDTYAKCMTDNASEWYVKLANMYYGGNPYKRLIDMAKKAQEVGVIKGILLHQGCSNNMQADWPQKVKKIYDDILSDLGLNAADVPLYVGETLRYENGGACYGHNTVIATMPQVIPTSHIIYSNGCPGNGADPWHFSALGYRIMGKRYAFEALRQMGCATLADPAYSMPSNLKPFFTATGLTTSGAMTLRTGSSKAITVLASFSDGHTEDVSKEITVSVPDFLTFYNGRITAVSEGVGTVGVSYTDFTGNTVSTSFTVESTSQGVNHVLAVNNGTAGTNPWDKQAICTLNSSMTAGKTYIVRATIRAVNGGDCALWPIFSTSSNKNQWGNSDDVQYLANYHLTSEFQEFEWEFSAQFPHDKLQFAFGLIGGMVYFDDVSCVEKGTTVEMVENGNFESDDVSNWAIISWAGQTMNLVEDTTNGISLLEADHDHSPSVIYDMMGRRVIHPTTGLYIINGRKVLVR